MYIKLNLHPVRWNRKPTSEEVGRCLKKDMANYLQVIEPEVLMMAIERGQTFTPAALTGSTADSWQSQQILCVDIDNGRHSRDKDGNRVFVPVKEPMTPAEALNMMAAYDIKPYFMYKTFSHETEGKAYGVDKFRIVVILDKPILDPGTMKAYNERLVKVFDSKEGAADTGTVNLDRILFGSVAGSVFYISKTVTATSSMEKLPSIEAPAQPVYHQSKPTKYNGLFNLLECLEYIDSDDREIWYKVGMALKHEGYTFEDWDIWASRCTDKHNRTDSIRVWKSLSANGSNGSITGAYITKLAKQNGYIPPSKRPRPAPVFLDWDSPIH